MQIKKYQDQATEFVRKLSDVRFAGQVVFVIIVLLISWSGIKTIQTNYGLQKQITGLKQQNDLQQLQNNNLQLQNAYYNSNQYLELSARQNFGLARPGEKELVVPESVALSYTTVTPVTTPNPTGQPPAYQRNYQSWFNFFFHRQPQN